MLVLGFFWLSGGITLGVYAEGIYGVKIEGFTSVCAAYLLIGEGGILFAAPICITAMHKRAISAVLRHCQHLPVTKYLSFLKTRNTDILSLEASLTNIRLL